MICALALAGPAAAAAQQLAPPPPPAPVVRMAPVAPMERYPQRARAERLKTVDIPQAAKDAGHNGTAVYTATIGADGKLIALALKQTSMSPAIDAAVEAAARKLYYFAATDKDGTKVQGTVDVVASYARHDADSPGGGIETYTCGDLVREYDWFTAANATRRKLFWLQNAYTSLTSVSRMLEGEQPSQAERLTARKEREAMWAKLIKRCRKTPKKLMLDEVDQRQAYANLVNSF